MRIVYYSFGGRYSDNPRAIYEALASRDDLDHSWFVSHSHAHGFPPGVPTVPMRSRRGVEALETADLVVANTYIDLRWTKRSGTRYVQTWHGTPLKRIHFDALWTPPGRIERLLPEVRRWDYLVSPNAYATGVLRSAFRYTGEVLEIGSPRNDALLGAEAGEVRARVRRELGIADGATAVLYTPTWRDDVVDETGRADLRLELDVDEFVKRLGDDHCLMLRAHYMLTERMGPIDDPAVRDVSFYPDIRDLYLAADVLVTDYSSTMFDFAVTGKPMLFYTYDFSHYRDEVRGFYFDFVAEAPGPLFETTWELIEGIRSIDRVSAAYAERYARFRGKFCHLDDGRATQRLIQLLLAPSAERVLNLA